MTGYTVVIIVCTVILAIVYLYKLHIKCWIDTIRYRRIYLKAQRARYKRKYR